MNTGTGRWMAGVFRELRHWIPADARCHDSAAGPTYYAAAPCHAPCIDPPPAAKEWRGWPVCEVCRANTS